MVDASGIYHRHIIRPLEELLLRSEPIDRNGLFLEHAIPLAEDVACRALERAGVAPSSIVAVVCVSCTGFAIPSLDAHLVNRLGINELARRVPISQLGCSAGSAGIAIASDLLRVRSPGAALVVSVELGSLLLQGVSPTDEDIVGAILFADGAAAAVLTGAADSIGPAIVSGGSFFVEDSTDILGVYLSESGFRLRLSRNLPQVVGTSIRCAVETFLTEQGVRSSDIAFYAIHPGGPKVLDVVGEALDVDEPSLRVSRDVIASNGNMSSATIFFVLAELQRALHPPRGALVLVIAPGAGMSLELLLLRWEEPLACD